MTILVSALLIWFYMTAWYFVSILKKRNDIADVAWGLGFILVTFLTLFLIRAANYLFLLF